MSQSISTPQSGLPRDQLTRWMLHSDRVEESLVQCIHGLSLALVAAGIPIFRANFLVRTLHPQLEFMVFTWQPAGSERLVVENSQLVLSRRLHTIDEYEIEESFVGHGHVSEEVFRSSPFHLIMKGASEVRCALDSAAESPPFPILDDLVELGGSDYFALPLQLRSPYAGAMSVATRAEGGFDEDCLSLLRELKGQISLFLAPVLTQQAAQVVLSAYLGSDPARRVMEGDVRLGDLDEMEAVIGFVDLRGYTRVSTELEGEALVELLDTFFTELHGLLRSTGGEILKFMGDGALVVFPIEHGGQTKACVQAAEAMQQLRDRIDQVNQDREGRQLSMLSYGVALHIGRVLYGNIGAPTRMDFTVVGSEVNLTARLEGLCGRLSRQLVVTRDFAGHLADRFESLGHYRVRGVQGEVEVFGLPE